MGIRPCCNCLSVFGDIICIEHVRANCHLLYFPAQVSKVQVARTFFPYIEIDTGTIRCPDGISGRAVKVFRDHLHIATIQVHDIQLLVMVKIFGPQRTAESDFPAIGRNSSICF